MVSVAVFEPARGQLERVRSAVAALGHQLLPETELPQLIARVGAEPPPDVVLIGDPGGDALLAACHAHRRGPPVTILVLAGPATTAGARCRAAGADLFALRPCGRDNLAPVFHAAAALVARRRQIDGLVAAEEILRARLRRYGEADAATGLQHLDFFRQLLVMEIKRAKRYRYSLAACLVVLDPIAAAGGEPATGPAEVTPEALRRLRTRVASAVVACVRDIDIPVDFADDRFLVFLPYTDLDGAERVGRRIARAVRGFAAARPADDQLPVSVSIGIAALRPGKPVSFARLMRDAVAAVRAAQLKGGGRVVVRR